MVEAILLLGSNIDKERNLPAAIARLRAHPRLDVRDVSRVFESDAVGGPENAPVFHNAALVVGTDLEPMALRVELRGIEAELGRVRTEDRNAPRTIDIDVVYYGDRVEAFDEWQLPDPGVRSDAHVAVPIADVAPLWVDPVTGRTAQDLADELGTGGAIQPIGGA